MVLRSLRKDFHCSSKTNFQSDSGNKQHDLQIIKIIKLICNKNENLSSKIYHRAVFTCPSEKSPTLCFVSQCMKRYKQVHASGSHLLKHIYRHPLDTSWMAINVDTPVLFKYIHYFNLLILPMP